jgi:16S rRNA (adenine1518-N6/adenine1519-N6)-dimethyltransferase
MALYKRSELLQFLDSIGAKPNSRLSQNFLIDTTVLDKIVSLAEVAPGDLVFEIGPGPGVLTEKLLAMGCEVIAIEKDPVFAKALTRFHSDRLHVVCADALDFNFKGRRKAKVVANLPYHLTTPIIEKLV